jgi:hypothetical protein
MTQREREARRGRREARGTRWAAFQIRTAEWLDAGRDDGSDAVRTRFGRGSDCCGCARLRERELDVQVRAPLGCSATHALARTRTRGVCARACGERSARARERAPARLPEDHTVHVRARVSVCVCIRVRVCVCVCVRACVRVCVRVCARACVRARACSCVWRAPCSVVRSAKPRSSSVQSWCAFATAATVSPSTNTRDRRSFTCRWGGVSPLRRGADVRVQMG